MKFHYGGKFTDESQLLRKPDPEGSVRFKEPDNMNKMAVVMNLIALVIFFGFYFLATVISSTFKFSMLGTLLFFASMVPHEFFHGLCFKEDVTMYTNLSKFMLFVYGTEDMSKTRFILMSLCPNIIFGLLPFIIFCIFPSLNVIGTLGVLAISAGGGDYLNVFNTLTQVPKGAKVYCNGINTYWYKD